MGKEPRRGDPGPATPGGVGRLTDHTSAGGQALCHRLGLPEPEDPFPLTNTTARLRTMVGLANPLTTIRGGWPRRGLFAAVGPAASGILRGTTAVLTANGPCQDE
jgi:hypothetical protein